MTPKQRYLFDLSSYLHLKNVLADDELREAQAAIDRLLATPLAGNARTRCLSVIWAYKRDC